MTDRVDALVLLRPGEACDQAWLARLRVTAGPLLANLDTADDPQILSVAIQGSRNDLVLVSAGISLPSGWLMGLRSIAQANERTAYVSPVLFDDQAPEDPIIAHGLAGMPMSGPLTGPEPACTFIRRLLIDLIGPPMGEIEEWLRRASDLGFTGQRALRVFGRGAHASSGEITDSLARHAVRVEASGSLRVGLDLRHLPPSKIGTTVYAVRLAEALAQDRRVELTLVVREHVSLAAARARVVSEERLLTGVDVLHKPCQVFDPADLELLLRSPASLVISHQDLIAHHVESVFPDENLAREYRARSYHILHAAQGIIAFTESTKREIATAYGLPLDSIDVVPHGLDSSRFENALRPSTALLRNRGIPERYFLAVGTDYPHKNLAFLVEAWRIARGAAESEFPSLILAGPPWNREKGFYQQLRRQPVDGVVALGEVDDHLLATLYRGALALVFPSVYEGFGLPPLEAMATGTPVITLPISVIDEVCAGAALHPTGTSSRDLANALTAVAVSADLRQQLRAVGRKRAGEFSTMRMVEDTLAAYRKAILHPREDSLTARRYLGSSGPRQGDLDSLMARLSHVTAQLDRVNRSPSFRLGLMLTAPLRRLLNRNLRSPSGNDIT